LHRVEVERLQSHLSDLDAQLHHKDQRLEKLEMDLSEALDRNAEVEEEKHMLRQEAIEKDRALNDEIGRVEELQRQLVEMDAEMSQQRQAVKALQVEKKQLSQCRPATPIAPASDTTEWEMEVEKERQKNAMLLEQYEIEKNQWTQRYDCYTKSDDDIVKPSPPHSWMSTVSM